MALGLSSSHEHRNKNDSVQNRWIQIRVSQIGVSQDVESYISISMIERIKFNDTDQRKSMKPILYLC